MTMTIGLRSICLNGLGGGNISQGAATMDTKASSNVAKVCYFCRTQFDALDKHWSNAPVSPTERGNVCVNCHYKVTGGELR